MTESIKPVVVGVDGSESSLDALREGARYAQLLGAPLRAVTTWSYPDYEVVPVAWDPEKDAEEIARDSSAKVFGDSLPAGFETVTRVGPPATALIEESASAQLLVTGSRGHGGFAGLLLGSVSSQCAEHAQCPVLIMHRPRPKSK